MCGIAGIVGLDGAPIDGRALRDMGAALAHRGPDARGTHIDGNVGLAHRRLSIIDLSDAGRQPMISQDGEVALVYNGEIYNYQALREDYEGRGYRFRSRTDTEVLLASYLLDGIACVDRFNGMFSFAIWDRRTRSLHLARDRYGIKPLYFATWGDTFVFASEIKALLRHPAARSRVNFVALNEYFTFQNLIGDHTLFDGVRLLEPGTTAHLDLQRGTDATLRHRRYWEYRFEADDHITAEEAEEETLRLFTQAVERQLVSDVPVGSYLSGGMDSGSIATVAQRSIPTLATFTCGFHLGAANGVEADFDERDHAASLAEELGAEHYQQVIGPADARHVLPTVVWHLEDLRLGMSYPNYFAARLASKFVTVCLSGTGGDELFGGYPWRYDQVLGAHDRESFLDAAYAYWQRLVPDARKQTLFQPGVARELDRNAPRRAFNGFFDASAFRFESPDDLVQNCLAFEAKTFLHGLFVVGDRLSMACGLEERVPFMDNDLVDFAMRIPIRHKLAGFEERTRIGATPGYRDTNVGKDVLRRAMSKIIPSRVTRRTKQGFSAPSESWYRGPNLEYVEERLLSTSTVSTEFIRPEFVRSVIRRHVAGENERLLIWSLLSFEEWCRHFLDMPTETTGPTPLESASTLRTLPTALLD